MSEFAKAQLMKYGWTEGKGLGKNENGITTALRPALKFDTAGIGHKDDDGNQWWESAYNKAASSLTVDPNGNGISICISETDTEKDLTAKKGKKHGTKLKSEYGNFTKTSTLSNGSLIPEEGYNATQIEDIENRVPMVQLTDEELLKACGGRTAHKGARHGLKLNGKLDRIARQEEEMLAKLMSNTNSQSASLDTFKEEGSKLRKRSRDSDDDESETDNNGNSILPLHYTSEDKPKFSKASKNKTNRKINDLTHQLDVSCTMNNGNEHCGDQFSSEHSQRKNKMHAKKKKKRKVDNDRDNTPVETIEEQKSKKNRDNKGNKEKNKNKKAVGKKQYVPLATEIVSQKLNHKISKKKAAKQERKMKEKLELLTQTFETVHVNPETPSKHENVKTKLENIVNNLESLDVTQDATEKMKKSGKTKKERLKEERKQRKEMKRNKKLNLNE